MAFLHLVIQRENRWNSKLQLGRLLLDQSLSLQRVLPHFGTRMSQEVSKCYNLLINGVYWGYNPLTNHLLTSWDILVSLPRVVPFFFHHLFPPEKRRVPLGSAGVWSMILSKYMVLQSVGATRNIRESLRHAMEEDFQKSRRPFVKKTPKHHRKKHCYRAYLDFRFGFHSPDVPACVTSLGVSWKYINGQARWWFLKYF